MQSVKSAVQLKGFRKNDFLVPAGEKKRINFKLHELVMPVMIQSKDQVNQQFQENILDMKEENTIFSDQLITQKQKNQTEDTDLNLNLMKLQQECSIYAQKIEIETKRKQDLEELVTQMRDKLFDQQIEQNAHSGAELPKKQKMVKKSEFTLQQIHQKHNEQIAEIQEQKELLNIARRERVIYSTVFKGIERDAIDKQHDFIKLIKQSELLKTELQVLSESLETIQNLSEFKQVEFKKEYENVFLIQNGGQKNNDLSSESRPNVSKIMKTHDSALQGEIDPQFMTEFQIIPNNSDMVVTNRTQNMNIVETADKLKEYEQVFEKLYVETGFKSTDQIIFQYNNQDQLIDDIYLEINNVTSSIDLTEKEIKEINNKLNQQLEKDNLDKMRKERSLMVGDGIQMNAIQKLDLQIEQLKEDLMSKKDSLLQIQSCLDLQILDGDVNEWNLNQYSRQLEEKINDIMIVAASLEFKEFTQSPMNKNMNVGDNQSYNDNEDSQSREINTQKLDDLLSNLEKMKESEKIITPEELKKQSLQAIMAREGKGKVSRRYKP